MSSRPTQNPENIAASTHTAVDVVLDTAYQNISAAQWAKLFSFARKSKLEGFIADMFAGKHINLSEDLSLIHI